MKRSRVEVLYSRHYTDMLDLNKKFIQAMSRPRIQEPNFQNTGPLAKKKLSKKQLESLARGRKILSLKRGLRA